MRELVIVKPARQLSLFEVGSNVLVGHLLKTGLDKICLLNLVLAADTSQLQLAFISPPRHSKHVHRQSTKPYGSL